MVGYDWPSTLARLAPRDFFDLPTLAFRFLTIKKRGGMRNPFANEQFLAEVVRIFAEENLCYEIDSAGGIHFKVDSEFATTTNAAIAALGAARYANAREQFETAMAALSQADINGKQGIRGVFNAVECVFKLMYARAPKLTSAAAVGALQPTVQKFSGSNPTALRSANKSINSFADWVDACHEYRHEQGVEEPSQPPIDLAVQLISVGSGFLRWLITIDQQTNGG